MLFLLPSLWIDMDMMNNSNKDAEGLKIRYFETCLLDGSVGFLNLSESDKKKKEKKKSDCLLVPPQLHFLSFAQTSSFRKWTKITTNSNPKIQASKCFFKHIWLLNPIFFSFLTVNAISYKLNIYPNSYSLCVRLFFSRDRFLL